MAIVVRQDHSTWCRDAFSEIELLRAYLEGLKQHLVDEGGRFHNEVETLQLSEHQAVNFFRGLDDEDWALEHLFTQHFPNLLLRSTFVSFYSFAEVTLNTLCERFTRDWKLGVSVSDMKGDGISRAKLYLAKLCKIDFGTLSDWEELNNLRKVRNTITHADGRVTNGSDKSLQSYIRESANLELEGDDLILSLECLDHFLDVMEGLIQGVGLQIQDRQGS